MFEKTCRDNLLALATAYSKAAGVSMSHVSKKAYGTVAFLPAFKKGDVSISLKKYEEIVEFFRKQWPKKLKKDWPLLSPIIIKRP